MFQRGLLHVRHADASAPFRGLDRLGSRGETLLETEQLEIVNLNQGRLQHVSGIEALAPGLRFTQQAARCFIRAHPVHGFGAEEGSDLHLLPDERGEQRFNALARDSVQRAGPVDILLEVEGRSSGAKAHPGDILFGRRLKLFRAARRRPYAYEQYPRSQRIKRAGVPDLQVLLPEVSAGGPLDFPDYVGGSPAVRFIHRQHDAVGIVGDVAGEHYLIGIFAMRRSCLPPSNSAASHSRTIETAIR